MLFLVPQRFLHNSPPLKKFVLINLLFHFLFGCLMVKCVTAHITSKNQCSIGTQLSFFIQFLFFIFSAEVVKSVKIKQLIMTKELHKVSKQDFKINVDFH